MTRLARRRLHCHCQRKDKPSYGMATDMQGNVVLLALDEVKQGSMPEDQKKAMVQGITQNNAQIVFES
ncbi:hypothetical protein ACLB1S_07715 [Escherichia coli]